MAEDHECKAHRMTVYAARVEAMDQGIGRVVDTLTATGQLDNTVLIFLSDDGASFEILPHVNMEQFRRRTAEAPHGGRHGEPMRIGNQSSDYPGPSDTYRPFGEGFI